MKPNYDKDLYLLIKEEPRARERKNKNRAVAKVLKSKFNVLNGIENKVLAKILRTSHSLDRNWRLILKENPSLRGSDYGDKDKLEKKTQKELGY